MKRFYGQNYFISRGYYACAVVALTNTMIIFWNNGSWKSKAINGTIWNTFVNIWNYTKTSVYYKANGVTYGTTNYKKAASGIKAYLKFRGYKKCKIDVYWFPRYQEYKRDLKNNKVCIFGYGLGGERHAVCVVGYVTTKQQISKSKTIERHYLQVLDGWGDVYGNMKIRYLELTNTNFNDPNGYSIGF